jgi:hypothetical protein
MVLLVLRRVGLCVGQNQMCHLCGWLKIELKKCAVGKIKNTEGLALSVGLVAVQLKYCLYVGHLSKLAFHFMFKVVRLVVVVSSVRLACNVLLLCVRAGILPQKCLRSTKPRLTQNRC